MLKPRAANGPPTGAKRVRQTAQQVQAAFVAAKGRLGSAGRLVGLAIGLIFGAFVLLALIAPLASRLPGWADGLVAAVPLVVLLAGLGCALLAVIKLFQSQPDGSARAPAGAAVGAANLPRPIGAEAIHAARLELIECGLVPNDAQPVRSSLSGRTEGLVVVALEDPHGAYAVIHLGKPSKASVLVAPGGAPWPGPLPQSAPLTPIPLPDGVRGLAWANDRQTGAQLMAVIGPVLTIAASGSALPFVCVRQQHACLSWPGGTLGTAALIGADLARALANQPS